MEHKELRLRLQGEIYRAGANKDGQQEGFNPILYNASTYTHTLSDLMAKKKRKKKHVRLTDEHCQKFSGCIVSHLC